MLKTRASVAPLWLLSMMLTALVAVGSPSAAQVIARVSVASDGGQGNHISDTPSISVDGRFVAFCSHASNLVPSDTNGCRDAFVHDRQTGQTTRVSVASAGEQAQGSSQGARISGDGRLVVFESEAANLVTDDLKGHKDIFVHDLVSGQTERVSVDGSGSGGGNDSRGPCVSADGRFVVYLTNARNLAGATSKGQGVVLRDRPSGTNVTIAWGDGRYWRAYRVAISGDGRVVAYCRTCYQPSTYFWAETVVWEAATAQGQRIDPNAREALAATSRHVTDPALSATGRYMACNGNDYEGCCPDDQRRSVSVRDRQSGLSTQIVEDWDSRLGPPSISADGRFVAYASGLSTIVPGDTNNAWDVFVHDMHTSRTCRVSVSLSGEQADADCVAPNISGDGRFIAFHSGASNLVAGDTNGAEDAFVARNPLAWSPVLSWLGTPGYEADGVDPDQGAGGAMRFRFKVLYSDADGREPRYVSLHLRRNGRPFREFAMARGTGDYTSGRVYRRTRKLPPGNYEHCFKARDRDGLATGEATVWTPGPIVGPRTAVAVTSLCVVPTNAGTQITFSLSSVAQVQARILNIAGRPVKTLCQAKDCEAGTNTLLWNATSDAGLRVPNGTYLVEVTARAGGETQARGLGHVNIRK